MKTQTRLSYRIACMILFSTAAFSASGQEKKENNFADYSEHPPIVEAGIKCGPPSDAVVLFDQDLVQWQTIDGMEPQLAVEKGVFHIVPGQESIVTRQHFGDCQLHVEWMVPAGEDHGSSLNWGNSGVYLMGLYEVQIYDSHKDLHEIYYNGQAGSLYKQHAPMVNCSRRAGEWQEFDIIFTAPRFLTDGTLESPAMFTVLHNGILIHHNATLIGPTTHGPYTEYKPHEEKLPLLIQSHGSAVSFRNIWLREL